jgi:hypothetical protein
VRKPLIAILIALALVVIPVGTAFASSTADVTITATPAYVSLSLGAVTTWPINGITGDGKIRKSTTYYANPLGDTTAPTNPVVDGDCRFTFTNDGNVPIDIVCDFADFASGDAMTNSNGGYTSNGPNAFGASGYESGAAWPGGAVIFQSSGSATFISNLAASGTKMWGVALLTQSGDFTSDTQMTSTITCTATEYTP